MKRPLHKWPAEQIEAAMEIAAETYRIEVDSPETLDDFQAAADAIRKHRATKLRELIYMAIELVERAEGKRNLNMDKPPYPKGHFDHQVQFPCVMLLYRTGDTYETFGVDATDLSLACGYTTFDRDGVIVCAFKHDVLESTLRTLLAAKFRVALMDQEAA